MKAPVVFDSTWGNTEKIAQAVAAGIGAGTHALRAQIDTPCGDRVGRISGRVPDLQ